MELKQSHCKPFNIEQTTTELHSLSTSTTRLHTKDIMGSIPPWTHRWGRSLLVWVFSSTHSPYWQVGSIQCKCQWVSPLCTLCTGRWGRSNANFSGLILCTLSLLEGGVNQCSGQRVWSGFIWSGVWCHSVFYV
jgi:hypothetical protein